MKVRVEVTYWVRTFWGFRREKKEVFSKFYEFIDVSSSISYLVMLEMEKLVVRGIQTVNKNIWMHDFCEDLDIDSSDVDTVIIRNEQGENLFTVFH